MRLLGPIFSRIFRSHSKMEFLSMRSRKREIEAAIENGIQFLLREQLESGEFKYFVTGKFFSNPTEKIEDEDWLYDQIVFGTSLVGNCLFSLKQRKDVSDMLNKALGFLESQREEPGVWRWHGPRDRDPAAYLAWPPDLDDTACALMFYEGMGKRTSPILLNFLLKYRKGDGLFRTFMTDLWWPDTPADKHPLNSIIQLRRILLDMDDFSQSAAQIDEEQLLYDFEYAVDAPVNANILALFSLTGRSLREVEDYINDCFRKETYIKGSIHYPSPNSFIYFCSKAYAAGCVGLVKSLAIIKDYCLSTEHENYGWGNSLQTAMIITSLIRLGIETESISKGVAFLLNHVNPDGGWRAECFNWTGGYGLPTPYFGSPSVSTAFCLEALQLYYETIKKVE